MSDVEVDKSVFDLILVQWISELGTKSASERKKEYVRSNFEDIFDRLKQAGAAFSIVHSFLPKIIKAHQPNAALAKNSYKRLKTTMGLDKTEKEYTEEWNKSIEDTGTTIFFEFFPLAILEEDTGPKVYGNMSAKEYRVQRRYADQFPTLDTTELEKRMHTREYNLDIEDLMKHVLGDVGSDDKVDT